MTKKISIYQIAYKNLLRKKTRTPADHPRHRPVGLGADQPVRLQPGLRIGPQQGHRQHGLPGAADGQGLPLRGGHADAQGRHRPALHARGGHRRHPQAPRGREASRPMLMQAVFDPNKGESGGITAYLGVDPATYPADEGVPQVQAGRLVHGPRWPTRPSSATRRPSSNSARSATRS